MVMEGDFIEPINLGNPEEVTILQIAKEIMELIPGTKSKIVHEPMPPDDPRLRCPDITRAKQVLGWSPVVPRKEGLARMIEHYRDQLIKK
jgi:nucleoside-diphosphate-sugar epimerase